MRSTSKVFQTSAGAAVLLLSLFAFVGHAVAQTCVQPPTGLIGWWPADGTANDIVNQNHGTLKNGATFASGKVGQAFRFDGVDDYVQLAKIHVPADTWTMDAWINPADFTCPNGGECMVLDIGSSGAGTLILSLFGGKPYAQWWTGSAAATAGQGGISSQISLNQWTHIAATHDGTTGRFYVNGQLVEETVAPSSVVPLPEAFIGKMHDGDVFRPFNGLVDEVEVYNRALSATEIRAIFDAGSAGKCKIRTVAIDIKPGSFPNSINLSSAGVVPVAILSNAAFDATSVDPATVTLAGATVRLIGKSNKFACSTQDVNEDGLLDLVCHVETVQFIIEPGESVAALEARTLGGQAIRGEDSIRIVP